jgi:hypothetical protein
MEEKGRTRNRPSLHCWVQGNQPENGAEMADSRRIAGLIGPTLVALGASEAINSRIWETNSAPLVYLNGLLLFVAGPSIACAQSLEA